MGRWGWRQVATLFMSVWVMAACSPARPTAPVQTALPQITPLLGTAPPTSSAAPAAAASSTAQPEPPHGADDAPTPRAYTVQPDDTLGGIAARFGVSADALVQANGGQLSDPLLPGHVLLIPASMSALPTGTLARLLPTYTPLPFSLQAPRCVEALTGEVTCLGWVANPLSGALADVMVQVTLHGGTGEILGRAASPLAQALIPPDDGAPYAVRFASPPDFARAEAVLLRADQAGSAAPAVTLAVIDSESAPQGAAVTVTATLRYDGDAPLTDLRVVITLLDDGNRVTGFRVLRPEGWLAAGQVLPVEAQVMPLLAGTDRHHVYGEGQPLR